MLLIADAGVWEVLGTLLQWAVVIGALIVGLGAAFKHIESTREYAKLRLEQQRKEFAHAQREMSRKLFETQWPVYSEICRVTSTIATADRLEQVQPAVARFRQIYWGELCLVEDAQVEEAMMLFGEFLGEHPGGKPAAELLDLSLNLAHACRKSLNTEVVFGSRTAPRGKINARRQLKAALDSAPGAATAAEEIALLRQETATAQPQGAPAMRSRAEVADSESNESRNLLPIALPHPAAVVAPPIAASIVRDAPRISVPPASTPSADSASSIPVAPASSAAGTGPMPADAAAIARAIRPATPHTAPPTTVTTSAGAGASSAAPQAPSPFFVPVPSAFEEATDQNDASPVHGEEPFNLSDAVRRTESAVNA